jgi:U4/U6 small nuclear ribonucleoprotein PRP3
MNRVAHDRNLPLQGDFNVTAFTEVSMPEPKKIDAGAADSVAAAVKKAQEAAAAMMKRKKPAGAAKAAAPNAAQVQALAAAAAVARTIAAQGAQKRSAPAPGPPQAAASDAVDHDHSSPHKRTRTQYKALLLDAQGREVDENGNLVAKQKTRAKVGGAAEARRLEAKADAHKKRMGGGGVVGSSKATSANPYLAHINMGDDWDEDEGGGEGGVLFDARLARPGRAPRAMDSGFAFVEPGSLVREEALERDKDRGRVASGRASGRKGPELLADVGAEGGAGTSAATPNSFSDLPPRSALDLECPELEWWDAPFLPKNLRAELKARTDVKATSGLFSLDLTGTQGKGKGKGKGNGDSNSNSNGEPYAATCYRHIPHMSPSNCKTVALVQHAPPIRAAPGGGEVALPLYLTKKERKKLRRVAREEKEQTKRDLQMMGLAPAAEPKFKLSNFMKILGDTALANPTAVEKKVLEKVKQRQLSHEIRNLSNKLVGRELTEKKLRKFKTEKGSTGAGAASGNSSADAYGEGCHVAVFRVGSLASNKHRYQLDISANQFCLAGIALTPAAPELSPGAAGAGMTLPAPVPVGSSLVVVEGGAKGVTKFTRLLTVRMDWSILPQEKAPDTAAVAAAAGGGGASGDEGSGEMDVDGDSAAGAAAAASGATPYAPPRTSAPVVPRWRGCELLWSGIADKHSYQQFRFQEFQTPAAARRTLESKGLQHYWDLLAQADL